MTSKADYEKQWEDSEPIERRARLNELAAKGYSECTEDERREHDALATMVAVDEDKRKDDDD